MKRETRLCCWTELKALACRFVCCSCWAVFEIKVLLCLDWSGATDRQRGTTMFENVPTGKSSAGTAGVVMRTYFCGMNASCVGPQRPQRSVSRYWELWSGCRPNWSRGRSGPTVIPWGTWGRPCRVHCSTTSWPCSTPSNSSETRWETLSTCKRSHWGSSETRSEPAVQKNQNKVHKPGENHLPPAQIPNHKHSDPSDTKSTHFTPEWSEWALHFFKVILYLSKFMYTLSNQEVTLRSHLQVRPE